MRITAFLGSGITVEIGGIMSGEMTQKVIKKEQIFEDFTSKQKINDYFLRKVSNVLNQYYNDGQIYERIDCNFEEIFYVLEMLTSLKRGERKDILKEYKPPIGAFIRLKDNFANIEDRMILKARHDLIETVAAIIAEYDDRFKIPGAYSYFKKFWKYATNNNLWNIITLNYDTCIETSIEQYEDGFNDQQEEPAFKFGCYRFIPERLSKTELSKVMHIHGCILYGHPNIKDPNKYAFNEIVEDVYKYETYDKAKNSWFGRTPNVSQSHDDVTIGPIITGLRKTDKLLSYPYSYYFYEFQKSIYNNSSLLIAGYSFGDLHFNELLIRMSSSHGKKRRIVIITYVDENVRKEWHPDIHIRKWPDGNACQAMSQLFQEEVAAKLNVRYFPDNGIITSQDGCVRLYLLGFKDAIQKYGKEIIDFLNS